MAGQQVPSPGQTVARAWILRPIGSSLPHWLLSSFLAGGETEAQREIHMLETTKLLRSQADRRRERQAGWWLEGERAQTVSVQIKPPLLKTCVLLGLTLTL